MSEPASNQGSKPTGDTLARIIARLHLTEDTILVILITVMAGLAITQIFLRNFFHGGLVWAEPMLRAMVLWVAMFGAMVATRDDKHIRIDVLTHYLSASMRQWANVVTHGFSAIICLLVAWHSIRFVSMEAEQIVIAFGFVPTWVVASAIPIAFSVIAIRFVLYVWRDLIGIRSRQP
ncbi:MAG: TRAP transporter small permease [Proteobacteria bacterium]|nr:TRAP transporter small permease [Pseudomonadota bacterium]